MKARRSGSFPLILISSLFLALAGATAEVCVEYRLSDPETKAVARFLEKTKGWRLACDADNANQQALVQMREWEKKSHFHPYLARGDFNHDGRRDFAAVFITVTSGKPAPDRVVVFEARGRSGFVVKEVPDLIPLPAGGLAINWDEKKNEIIFAGNCFFCDSGVLILYDAVTRSYRVAEPEFGGPVEPQ